MTRSTKPLCEAISKREADLQPYVNSLKCEAAPQTHIENSKHEAASQPRMENLRKYPSSKSRRQAKQQFHITASEGFHESDRSSNKDHTEREIHAQKAILSIIFYDVFDL